MITCQEYFWGWKSSHVLEICSSLSAIQLLIEKGYILWGCCTEARKTASFFFSHPRYQLAGTLFYDIWWGNSGQIFLPLLSTLNIPSETRCFLPIFTALLIEPFSLESPLRISYPTNYPLVQTMALSATCTHLFHTSKDRDSSSSLGRPFQCLITLCIIKHFLITNLNLPWHSLRPFTHILSTCHWEKETAILLTATTFQIVVQNHEISLQPSILQIKQPRLLLRYLIFYQKSLLKYSKVYQEKKKPASRHICLCYQWQEWFSLLTYHFFLLFSFYMSGVWGMLGATTKTKLACWSLYGCSFSSK